MPPKRYFDDLADNVKPGVISDRLREAIGLDHDKLPIWIYRMRVLGYPPGWLKVADMSQTVIPLVAEASDMSAKKEDDHTYNVESLVVYPGFNAPVPEGVGDDHRLLRMPPLMSHQQLDFATSTMKTPKPVPYKRLKITSPEPRTPQQHDDDCGPTTKQILQMIESRDETQKDESSPTVKLIQVGVGVPVSYKVKKPPLEKWSENNTLSELIYFENLPNYTGVFNKMRTVLGGVRNKLFGSTPTTASDERPAGDQSQQTAEESETPVILLGDETGNCNDDDDVPRPANENDGEEPAADVIAQNTLL